MSDVVLVETADRVATVRLNRPDKLNALNRATWESLAEVMARLDRDDDIGCVVLTGAGDRAFSPGADIAEFATERADVAKATAYGETMHATMGTIAACRHPTLAAIKGVCVGGGLEIALMCDMRICGISSRFGVPINRLGLVMAYPEIEALIRLTGESVALEILFEARIFGAEEALEKRLVNRIVADDKVEAESYAAARRIADGAPLVNRWHKKFARRLAEGRPLTPEEAAEGFACFATEDYRAGRDAFLAKAKPVFKGR
ncbi:MAG: enoyl-CoA hydratase/isomerase family protein [Alphaproteobacteria bacterium]|nr:enoyl-CoA hydratase/isomerase family protein [Alphaproteobacteria bacterium]